MDPPASNSFRPRGRPLQLPEAREFIGCSTLNQACRERLRITTHRGPIPRGPPSTARSCPAGRMDGGSSRKDRMATAVIEELKEEPRMSAPVREYRRLVLRSPPSEGTIAASLFIASAGVVFSAWGTDLLFEAFIAQPLCHGPLGCDVAYWIASGLVQVGLGTPLLVLAIILWSDLGFTCWWGRPS